jgi:phage-related protein
MSDFPPVGMLNGEDSAKFSIDLGDNTVSSKMEDGYEISRPRSTRRPRKKYNSGFTDISDAERVLIENFYEQEAAATANAFSWTEPTSQQELIVRFAERIKFEYVGYGANHRWNLAFSVKEV